MKNYFMELREELEDLQFIISRCKFSDDLADLLHEDLRTIRKEINERSNGQ